MTALEHVGHGQTPARHPLAPGASPAAVRQHLLREDRPRFDVALADARNSGDPEVLDACLEHWRRVAIVERDRDGFTRIVRRAAESNTGRPSPPDEPLATTRAKARM
jgi:hypothetical protein